MCDGYALPCFLLNFFRFFLDFFCESLNRSPSQLSDHEDAYAERESAKVPIFASFLCFFDEHFLTCLLLQPDDANDVFDIIGVRKPARPEKFVEVKHQRGGGGGGGGGHRLEVDASLYIDDDLEVATLVCLCLVREC